MKDNVLCREIFDRLKAEGFSEIIRNSTMRVLSTIGVDKFPESNEAQWLAAYRKARPNSSVDLGKLRITALKFVKAQMNVIRAEEAELLKKQEAAKAEAILMEEKRKAEEAEQARLKKEAEEAANPMISAARIKTINDWLELNPEIEKLDLRGIEAFMKCYKLKGE